MDKLFSAGLVLVSFVLTFLFIDKYTEYKLDSKIAKYHASQPQIMYIDDSKVADYFEAKNYSTEEQIEYSWLMENIFKHQGIFLLSDKALKFKSVKSARLHSIKTLRKQAEELGIENPRLHDPSHFKRAALLQDEFIKTIRKNIGA